MKTALATLTVLSLPAVVAAQHCATPVKVQAVQHYAAPAYHAPYVAPVQHYTPYVLAVFVPAASYSIGLSAEKIEPLTEEKPVKPTASDDKLDLILKRLEALEGRPAALPQTAAPVSELSTALAADGCTKCHSGGKAKGGVDLTELTVEVRAAAAGKVAALKTCTKAKPLTPERQQALLAAFFPK